MIIYPMSSTTATGDGHLEQQIDEASRRERVPAGNVEQDGRAGADLLQASWYEIDCYLSFIQAQNY